MIQSVAFTLTLPIWPIRSCKGEAVKLPTIFFLFHLDGVLDFLLLARSLDNMGQITDWYTEREIEGCKHDGQENPPARQGRDECEGTTGLASKYQPKNTCLVCVARGTYDHEMPSSLSSHCVCSILVRECQVPVCAREAAEGADEGEEDNEEGDVGAKGTDEEDEADES